MRKVQSGALIFAVVCGALGLLTSTGCPVLPPGDPRAVALLHPLVIVMGALAGFLLPFRTRAVDEERWRVVEDAALTSGEREYAHQEAEREKKTAGIVFLMAPLTLGFWLAYHFRQETITAADFLTVTPLLGFAMGWPAGWWASGRKRAGPAGPGNAE